MIILPRVYVGDCASNRSVGRPRKRWADTVRPLKGESPSVAKPTT